MPISTTPLEERIARVLAGARLSDNAEGATASAADEVDQHWRDHLNEAIAVLHTLREPDEDMAAEGDADTWSRMVERALRRTDAR